ncbi:MAG: hypothetical protein OXR84_12960 [Magnetovibrio sp.]|nr:hypothetical protein [Magnetovibrio sp.]
MALIPKVYAPTPAQTAAATRALPTARVASTNGAIEESSSSLPATFDAAPFTLQEDQQRRAGLDQNPSRDQGLPRQTGRLVVPSREFSSLVEYSSTTSAGNDDPDVRARNIGGIISRAISTYETNAKIIHGEPEVTGTEVSLRL